MNIFLSVYIKKHRRSAAAVKVLIYAIRKEASYLVHLFKKRYTGISILYLFAIVKLACV